MRSALIKWVGLVALLLMAWPVFGQIKPGERAALIAFHQATGGQYWVNDSGWLGPDGTECSWFGVTCNSSGTAVIGLELRLNGLRGRIPGDIGGLVSLETLVLSANSFYGALPSELGQLTSLRVLDLGANNSINGTIPDSIGELTMLEHLDLRSNELTGPLPETLGELVNLRTLHLFATRIDGQIPATLGNLSNLEEMYLHGSRFSGTIPSTFGNLDKLRVLLLWGNKLTGPLPGELGSLTRLERLWLQYNQISGGIPSEIGNLSALVDLHLHQNLLEGPIPPSIGGLKNLKELRLENNSLTGPLPPSIGGLKNLKELRLARNSLTGPLPAELGDLSNLEILFLGRNQIDGTLPARLGELTNLRSLSLSSNLFGGVIPIEFSKLESLKELDLLFNRLTGPIPAWLGSMSGLEYLGLGWNQMEGRIPAEIGNLHNLKYLFLTSNKLVGPLPPSLTGLTALDEFYIGYNALYSTDAEMIEWATQREYLWATTQTVAPAGLSVDSIGATIAALKWSPILFRAAPGRYEVRAEAQGGATIVVFTNDKNANRITLNGLLPDTAYEFSIRSITDPWEGAREWDKNKNTVVSEYSEPVTATTTHTPRLSIDDASVLEGDEEGISLDVPVSLSPPAESAVTVDWETADGTATSGVDFVAGKGNLLFQPGQSQQAIRVMVLGDRLEEGDEFFFINLITSNADIADGQARITIVDNDVAGAPIPDPVIVVHGCTRAGYSCRLLVESLAGEDTSTWQYQWFLDGSPQATGAHWKPVLGSGTHDVVVWASNATGKASASVILEMATPQPCSPDALCALDGRFELTLTARDQRTGNIGSGVPIPRNDLFGYFALPSLTSDPNNPEVFVKVLDGRYITGDFWVFFGALTDLELALTVSDTIDGTTKSYVRPAGSSAGGFDTGTGVTSETCRGEVDGVVEQPALVAPCNESATRLCLNGGRFQVSLEARDHRTGAVSSGVTIPENDLFGYFSIPGLTGNLENPEVFVKLLDGRPVNGYFWFFYGGLTDLEYTLTIADTTTGLRKTYKKSERSACGGFDSNAF